MTGIVPTIRGAIEISLVNRQAEPFELRINIPSNMTATVGVPRRDKQSRMLVVNGKKVEAVLEDEYLFLEDIGSGSHLLISK